MEERLTSILEAAIQGFIATGEPVSSKWIYENYNFGIKPAMIRLELTNLTDQGYLDQPHHSAGRIPTDRGLEFFAERILEQENPRRHISESFLALFQQAEWSNLLDVMTKELGVLGVADDYERGEIYKRGLDDLINNLDWETPEEIKAIIKDFEALDQKLSRLNEALHEDRFGVFIGKKSPITKSDQLAVVAGSYGDEDEKILLVAIGPKRMNYKKVIDVFKNF